MLRYGQFHGSGTWAATAADIPDDGPKVGVDHAAAATVLTSSPRPASTPSPTDHGGARPAPSLPALRSRSVFAQWWGLHRAFRFS